MHNKKVNSNKSNAFIQGLRPLSSSLPRDLKRLLKKGGYNFSNIVDNWVKMVGKDISNTCYPNTIRMDKDMKNGTLVLNVIHGNELTKQYFYGIRAYYVENVSIKGNSVITTLNVIIGYCKVTGITTIASWRC